MLAWCCQKYTRNSFITELFVSFIFDLMGRPCAQCFDSFASASRRRHNPAKITTLVDVKSQLNSTLSPVYDSSIRLSPAMGSLNAAGKILAHAEHESVCGVTSLPALLSCLSF